ncbi:hypothetical protein V6N11_050930 [Hibiscus sabdariffa]|uniref:Uncharacterized protein n=1 Tax=Hibiscus sabdariffa TaxID=183260 RepID=A0ABR2R2B5_9ROSI
MMNHQTSGIKFITDVSTSAPAPIVDPEVLPQGPITRSKAKQFREALFLVLNFPIHLILMELVCSSFQLNEADTPSVSSFQLIEAPFSSTSATLAQLKLNNPEAAETRPMYGRVTYKHVDSLWTSKHVHGTLFEHMHGMCIPHTWAACGRPLFPLVFECMV